MEEQNLLQRTATLIRRSATIKIFSIGLLILIMLIPAFMVEDLMRERRNRHDQVVEEISSKWGDAQTIAGPILTLPYKRYFKTAEGKTRYTVENLHFLPKSLAVSATLKPEIRYRGIYQAVLYNADLAISGEFTPPDYGELNVEPQNVLWSRGFLSLGITDMRGIKQNITATLNGQALTIRPGIDTKEVLESGVSARLPAAARGPLTFDLHLNLNGSEKISFIPVGELTTVHMQSSWPSPSFVGAFLPESRSIDKEGFTADWRVLHLNRNFPQAWKGDQHRIAPSAFGMKLFVATDIYQKAMRTAKYAIMFIVFTFTAFFFAEIMNRKRLHPIQYLLVGIAMIVFYTLLISLSEHISFNLAYWLAAGSVILLVSGYARGILRSNPFALTVFGILLLLYLYLFMVLQLEDYALLMGAIGLFTILALIMYLTRQIDWYGLQYDEPPGQGGQG